jgi:hypothetical protein
VVFLKTKPQKVGQPLEHFCKTNHHLVNAIDNILLRWRPQKFVVIGVLADEATLDVFGMVEVVQRQGKLHFTGLESNAKTLAECAAATKGKPVLLHVEGPALVHRHREEAGFDTQEEVQAESWDEEAYAAVMHKEAYERLLQQLAESQLRVLGVHLGCAGLSQAQSQPIQAQVGHYAWEEVPFYNPPAEGQTVYFDERTTPSHVSLYMRAVSWAASPVQPTWHGAWVGGQLKRYITRVAMPLTMVVLLANFMVFQPLYNEVGALQSIAAGSSFRGWEQQKQAEEQRKAFISRNAVTDPGILSWQLDELLRLMPLEITLTEVRQNYLQGPMHPGKALVFAENTLLLSGRTGNAASLSLWMQQISALPWVESNTMNGFSATGTQARFSLELHINATQPKP